MLSSVPGTVENPHVLRRFFARFIDMLLACSLVTAGEAMIRTNVQAPPLLFLMAVYCGWILVEAQLLVLWQTTPGKFLLKIRVQTLDGKSATYWRAVDRGLTVFTRGLGCLVPMVIVPCAAMSYEDLKRSGTTRWDRGRFRLVHQYVGPWRYVLVASAVTLALLVIGAASITI
jgi:hypothetical protein